MHELSGSLRSLSRLTELLHDEHYRLVHPATLYPQRYNSLHHIIPQPQQKRGRLRTGAKRCRCIRDILIDSLFPIFTVNCLF